MAAAESTEQLLIAPARVTPWMPARFGAWLRTGGGLLLVALAAGPGYTTLRAAAAATIQPGSLDLGEAMVYAPTQRILSGQPLYQSIAAPPYTVTPYTPLYYYAAALLRAVLGEGFGPGRALSLAAGVASALLIALVAGRIARAAWAGGFAAVLFLGLAFPGGAPWLGLYRVDMFGLAFSVAAVAVLCFFGCGLRGSILAGSLAGLALLSKETYFAALLTGLIWLWPVRRQMLGFISAALLVISVPCVWLQATTGALVQNALADINPPDASVAGNLFAQFLRAQWLPLALATLYLVVRRPWRRRDDRLLLVYWAAASLQLVGLAKVGANHNYWIELAAATAALAALGANSLLRLSRLRFAIAGCACLVAVLASTTGGGFVQMVVAGLGAIRSEVTEVQFDVAMVRRGSSDPRFQSLVDRVRQEPGIVLADPPDVLVLANRPIYLEPLIFTILQDEGRWRGDEVVHAICEGDVHLLVLAYPLEAGSIGFGRFGPWPPAVLAALRSRMQLDQVVAGRSVYTPRTPTPVDGC